MMVFGTEFVFVSMHICWYGIGQQSENVSQSQSEGLLRVVAEDQVCDGLFFRHYRELQ